MWNNLKQIMQSATNFIVKLFAGAENFAEAFAASGEVINNEVINVQAIQAIRLDAEKHERELQRQQFQAQLAGTAKPKATPKPKST